MIIIIIISSDLLVMILEVKSTRSSLLDSIDMAADSELLFVIKNSTTIIECVSVFTTSGAYAVWWRLNYLM